MLSKFFEIRSCKGTSNNFKQKARTFFKRIQTKMN